MPKRLYNLVVREVSFVPRGANNKTFLLFKSMDGKMKTNTEPGGSEGNPVLSGQESIEKQLDLEKTRREALEKQVQDLEKAAGEKVILEKRLADLEAENQATKERLEKAETQRILKEHIEKAEKSYPHAGDPAKIALITKEIAQKVPEAWAELEPILKAMSEQIEKGELFKEMGKSTSSESDDNTALAEINKMAKERVEKGLDTDFASAWTKVVNADRELYGRYLTETRGA